MKGALIIAAFMFFSCAGFAQQKGPDSSKLIISGYMEIYYGYDFNKPLDNTRPRYFYNYTRTNEVSLNLAFLKAVYAGERVRASIALMAGTYPNANLASEPGTLKNLFEAYTGIKLSTKANLWLDAGVFTSHIGFESAVGKDCWTLTRSIMADNSPYYESGAKLGYTSNNGKLAITALLLNGWQHIARPAGNTGVSEGLQLTWQPTSKITFNYSNFYGNDKPDSVSRQRFYNDFYIIYQFTKKAGLTAGFDFASEQKYKGSSAYNYLYSPVLILRYKPADPFAVAGRVEYYQDPNGILIATGTSRGFRTAGYSLNADYSPFTRVLVRIEGRYLAGRDAALTRNNLPAGNDFTLTTSLSVVF